MGLLRAVAVGELGRHEDLNEREKNERGTHQDKRIESRQVRQLRHVGIDRETIRNQRQHRGNRDRDLSARIVRLDPENGPRHRHDQNQRNDHLDDEMMQLLGQRMNIADKIGQYKRANNITILQTNRWNEILERSFQRGEKVGLSKEFITRYLDAVHMESINHQNKIMNS